MATLTVQRLMDSPGVRSLRLDFAAPAAARQPDEHRRGHVEAAPEEAARRRVALSLARRSVESFVAVPMLPEAMMPPLRRVSVALGHLQPVV